VTRIIRSNKNSKAAAAGPIVTHVICDLDGTLLESEGASHAALEAPLRVLGVESLSWDLHADVVGRRPHGPEGWASIILRRLGLEGRLSEAAYINAYHVGMAKRYASLPLIAGALPLLERLHTKGVRLAIATSSHRGSFEKKMQYHRRVLDLVDVIVCGDDAELERGKPAPDIFMLAAARLGVRTEAHGSCLVFEDSPFGVQGAKAAGMLAVALPDPRLGAKNASRFEAADWTLSALSDFDEDSMVRLRASTEIAASSQ